jgi:hypothetical protein
MADPNRLCKGALKEHKKHFYLLSKKRAKAKLNQMLTNPSFLMAGVSKSSITSKPGNQGLKQ